jgi:two-component system, OmpR family, phosphate regulon sensor histidine kinase PhoR
MRDAVLRQPTAAALAGAGVALVLAVVYGAHPWMTAAVAAAVFAGAWTVLRTAAAERTVAGHEGSGLADARHGADMSWRSVIDALPDAAIVLSGTGRVLRSSRAARDLFTTLRNGQTLDLATRNPDLLGAVEQALATRTSATVQTLERVPVERRLSATLSPLQPGSADMEGPALLVVLRDISQEERLAQMRADFIANASHELRTPLTSLRGFIETLQGLARDDPEARSKFLDIMSTQAGRMTRLLDDLLSLSRLEMRAHVAPRGEVEINALVREVVDLLQPIAREAGITMIFAGEPAECLVRGDRDELVQVFQNLVQNAIKYGGSHVDVMVTRTSGTGRARDRVIVEVRDDGPGIAEEHLPRLTERFYRVDVAASRDKGGTGLGLAIVKHVLNRHGGQLRITSTPGAGSTFAVVLDLMA